MAHLCPRQSRRRRIPQTRRKASLLARKEGDTMLLNKYLFMLSVHMIVPDGEGSGSGSGTGTEGEGSAKGADTGDTDDDAGDDDDDDEDDTDPVSLRAKIKAQKERADAADAKAARRIKEIKRLKAEREGQSKPKTDQGGKPAAKEGTVPKDGGTPEADAKVAEAEKKAADAEARALTSSRKGDLGYQLSALGIGKADARDIIDLALLNQETRRGYRCDGVICRNLVRREIIQFTTIRTLAHVIYQWLESFRPLKPDNDLRLSNTIRL